MHQLHISLNPSICVQNEYDDYYDEAKISLEVKLFIKNTITLETETPSVFINLIDLISGVAVYNNQKFYKQTSLRELNIFSCDCGYPECVGIYNGILLKHKNKFINWRITKDDGYNFLNHSSYCFNREEYISLIIKIRNTLIELEKKYPNKFLINHMSIPQIFKSLCRGHIKFLYKKSHSENGFSCDFFVDTFLNNFSTATIKGITRNSIHKKLFDNLYKEIYSPK